MPKTYDLLHDRIEQYINKLIKDGTFAPGSRLPSERELAAKFGASKIPVRQATQRLVDRGLLQRIPGKGTFLRNARSITPKTGTLAIVQPHSDIGFFSTSYYMAILEGIETRVRDAGQNILFRSLDAGEMSAPEKGMYDLLDLVDGYIVISLFPEAYRRLEKTIRHIGKPVVLVNYEGADDDIDCINTDSRANMRKIVREVIAAGHTSIGIAVNRKSGEVNPRVINRIAGYRDALSASGIMVNDDLMLGDLGQDAFQEYYRRYQPTAIVCAADYIAVSVYKWCRSLGIRIPEDLAVTGYGNIREVAGLDPGLTTVDIPAHEMGAAAAARLLEKIRTRPDSAGVPSTTVFPGKVLLRESHFLSR